MEAHRSGAGQESGAPGPQGEGSSCLAGPESGLPPSITYTSPCRGPHRKKYPFSSKSTSSVPVEPCSLPAEDLLPLGVRELLTLVATRSAVLAKDGAASEANRHHHGHLEDYARNECPEMGAGPGGLLSRQNTLLCCQDIPPLSGVLSNTVRPEAEGEHRHEYPFRDAARATANCTHIPIGGYGVA